jgi:hypothetical protein
MQADPACDALHIEMWGFNLGLDMIWREGLSTLIWLPKIARSIKLLLPWFGDFNNFNWISILRLFTFGAKTTNMLIMTNYSFMESDYEDTF